MQDFTNTTLLVGLAVALAEAVKWLAKALAKRNGHNGNGGTNGKAGEKSVAEWELRMRKIHEDVNEDLMKDIRYLMDARNEKLREIVREELDRQ